MGPGSGERGGEIVFFGKLADLLKCKRSRTGQAMKERMSPPRKKKKRKKSPPSPENVVLPAEIPASRICHSERSEESLLFSLRQTNGPATLADRWAAKTYRLQSVPVLNHLMK